MSYVCRGWERGVSMGLWERGLWERAACVQAQAEQRAGAHEAASALPRARLRCDVPSA
jgi:hypothetical protein